MSKAEEKYRKRKLTSSYLTSVVSITLVLFTLGMLGLLLLHAKKISNHVKENVGFSVFIKDDVNEAEIVRFQKSLDITSFVKSTEYITKEEAAESLQEQLGENFIEFLGGNPLLPSIDIRLNADYSNIDSLRVIEKELLLYDIVKEVFYQENLVSQINNNLAKISLIILAFSGLMLLTTVALINNTIRLSVYSRRFIIRTMQLVGATRHFIRKPFIIRSLFHGMISALLAICLLLVFIYIIAQQIPEILDVQDLQMFLYILGIVMAIGIFISWISTYFAIRKFLRMDTDDLYY
ncbi:MAG: ABC transporter permease [Bacteroidales bacterium]|nr:ABC transporter permease [Bacteroidales bacterium]